MTTQRAKELRAVAVEYALLLSLIVIVCIAAYTLAV